MTDNLRYSSDDFDYFWDKIERGENISLARYGDGEKRIILRQETKAQEGWYSPNKETILGNDLKDSLCVTDERYFYGISCPCCDLESYCWYIDNVKTENITSANLWVSANYPRFMNRFLSLNRKAVTITNYAGKGKKFGSLEVLKQYFVDDSCVDFWKCNHDAFVQRIIDEVGKVENILFVVYAGPMSGVIISRLFQNNPNNCYIDFGSALDEIIYGKITRPYMQENSFEAKKICWIPKRKKCEFDIDVILTAYKRPECLRKQLEAIKNQSIKVKHIFLYQDGIDDEYSIEIKDSLLSEFDNVFKNQHNTGVWGRFFYAKEISKAQYVCVFDDDTIPGRRWLENCWTHMQEKEGIYGTNGIVLDESITYPYTKNDLRIGWHNPNNEVEEVDFVGHSWFMEKKCLDYLIDYCQKYDMHEKCVGEDMCLSVAAQMNGIYTYVPPHPMSDYSLWGSLPQYGISFGTQSVAISVNSKNYESMNRILKKTVSNGANYICKRDIKKYTELKNKYTQTIEEYSRKSNEKLIEKCKKADKIYIYGAGKYAKLLYKLFSENELAVENFVVTNVDFTSAKEIDGIKIVQYSDIESCITEKDIIIIGVGDFFQHEIRNNIVDSRAEIYPAEGSVEKQLATMG